MPTFDVLFREHYAFIHRTLRALGVDPTAVDDAAQEVFLVVHRRLGDYDGRASARAWIFGIARRVAHDFRRKDRRLQARLTLVEDTRSVATPEHQLAQQQVVTRLNRHLDTLNEIRRAVFVLCEIEEMTAPEVAAALDIKLNTVYSHLRKARLTLERAMAGERTMARGQ
ncbi:MAG: RNA polymerase sigma factor [Nannocystis sp.]|nr:RNA polymerase sigma factor [Nannocystis sp.]MBA3544964.1 RNA polymerase sigma factor [Nannocystis sp.]